MFPLIKLQPIDILMSYHYYKNPIQHYLDKHPQGEELINSIVVDSGGFSAFTQGVPIDINDYIKWIQENYKHSKLKWFANFDVVYNPIQTLNNQKYMEDKLGYSPVPVFHVGTPIKYLEYYVDNYDFIALGGLVPYLSKGGKLEGIIKDYLSIANNTRFHGFGIGSLDLIKAFNWQSTDSSSWTSVHRFTRLQLWDGQSNQLITLNVRNRKEVEKYKYILSNFAGIPIGKIYPYFSKRRGLYSGITLSSIQKQYNHFKNSKDYTFFFVDGSISNFFCVLDYVQITKE